MDAIDKIEKASKDGQIRRFTGNEYVRDVVKGDSIAILGWSGDAVQLIADNPNIKYRQPEEGFMIFTDSMQIPVGAPHAFTAEKFMDFVYRPEIQAAITGVLNYVPPGEGQRARSLEKSDPEIAEEQAGLPGPLARRTTSRRSRRRTRPRSRPPSSARSARSASRWEAAA